MNDHDVDDIAFLTGSPNESGFMMSKRAMYEPGSVMVCSQKRACVVVSLCFTAIIAVALIVASTKAGCPEATYTGEPLPGTYSNNFGIVTTTPPTATNGEEFPWNDIRLPLHIRPMYYNLHLHPNFTTKRVKGNLTIKLNAIEETDFIILHAYELNVTHHTIHNKYKQGLDIVKFLEYPPAQQIYIGLKEKLSRGSNYTLTLSFEGRLSEGLQGFYLSSYKDLDGNKRYVASTHFEPTGARWAFPCFDEPQLKARFQLSLVRDEEHFTLFNMPLAKTVKLEDNLYRDEFDVSVRMSTYLVAFVVCDYANITAFSSNNIKISVYAPHHMIDQANYALNITTNLLDYYQTFFDVLYPLPKLDLIAIPNFGAGAMENWGLITYRETALMFEPDHTAARSQQRVTTVIAHELAHQWFGNLVTMNWWQDVWLNEGFASFIENIGTGKVEPTWSMEEQFVTKKVQPALELDALLASHAISTEVHDPAQIESIFDTISYKKGASLISMLRSFMGDKILRDGLRTYLSDHEYSNANTNDLWRAFSRATSKNKNPLDIKAIMETWTLQAGFPLVTVEYGDGRASASQFRFLVCEDNITDPNEPLNNTIGYKWHVPLTYISSANPHDPSLIWMNLNDVEFEVPNDLTWIKFNVAQRGYYRVQYDTDGWQNLIHLLQTDHLTLEPADRASLIDDVFTLVKAGQISATVALDLSLYLVKERNEGPWNAALRHLFAWSQLLFNYPVYTMIMSYIHSLIYPVYKEIGWEDKGTHLQKLLRSEILMAAVDCGDHEAITEATNRFKAWRLKNETIPPNLRTVVYRAGIRYGIEDDWHHCWNVYNSSSIPSEKNLMLRAMAQTRDPWLMQQYLEYTLDSSKIRPQDVRTVLAEVSINPAGNLAAWRMVRKNWDKVADLFQHGSFTLGSIIKSITSTFNSEFDLAEVEYFFKDLDVGPAKRALDQALETIRLHIQWHDHNLGEVTDWLNEQLNKEGSGIHINEKTVIPEMSNVSPE